ncbi:MAG TPA: cupredoxin domain-containing protein [Conexibacter sp.]|nr:cupredoxin domain-containing protein [Conexibacter sp.]
MRRTAAAAVVALALLLASVAGAGAATQSVDVQFDTFSPSQLDLLPGETVTWSNVSPRVHTVTSDSGLFDAGELGPGAVFVRGFDDPGAYAYHCTIHAGMVGEIDVRRVILGPLPTVVVPAGERVELGGRAADVGRPVSIQRSVGGGAFATVASTSPAPDGSWRTTVVAESTSDFRATSGAEVSQTRRLLVSERRVQLRKTRRGVVVTVTPSVPYARVMLQADLHERFGWWPIARSRLDYLSQASFRVRKPARVRAVLVAKDGWTPLATSPVVVLGHARPTHMGGMHMHAVARRLS